MRTFRFGLVTQQVPERPLSVIPERGGIGGAPFWFEENRRE